MIRNRKIIIGDIHGCLATFEALLAQLQLDREDHLYLLGDYVDRGPNSKGVIDKIISLKNENFNLVTLRGNHEQMLLSDFIAETEKGWHNMADEALKSSFGIKNLKELPLSYIDFCQALPYYHEEEDFILVHAGLNFNYEEPLTEKEDLLWIRDWYHNINLEWLGKKIIVHGHTPQTRSEIEDQFRKMEETQVLDIDCGVFLAHQKEHGLGYLCGFDFTNRRLYFQENIDFGNKY